jgi:hypothetical protein
LAKPNYQFEKRQKEIAKKKKAEEKLKRKQEGHAPQPEDATSDEPAANPPAPEQN